MRARVKLPGLRTIFVLLVVSAASVGACSLNPQPIPPGDQADGGNSDFSGGGSTSADASTNNPTPGDAGIGQNVDSGPGADDAGEDASTDDGGDDAGDAEADAM